MPSSPSTPPAAPIPDEEPSGPSTLPLPLSASIILTSLPRDAHSALEKAVQDEEASVPKKVTIRFQPIGSAPHLKQRIFKISSSNNFSTVVNFLRKKLFDPKVKSEAGEGKAGGNGQGGGSVFCYVNSVFAPGLDEGVGGLWRVSDFVYLDREIGIGGKGKKGKRMLTGKAVFQDG
ncbi:3-methyl-2-oxobutanoate hydroxymethyltransferase [Physcia stellaris]|nr:3-methyl-2-oxobutanoate hydroxymethyltransferase [Physcia stellaris]